MKLLMKKVGDPAREQVIEESNEQTPEEQQPKKIRNRPLFHVKVSIMYLTASSHRATRNVFFILLETND